MFNLSPFLNRRITRAICQFLEILLLWFLFMKMLIDLSVTVPSSCIISFLIPSSPRARLFHIWDKTRVILSTVISEVQRKHHLPETLGDLMVVVPVTTSTIAKFIQDGPNTTGYIYKTTSLNLDLSCKLHVSFSHTLYPKTQISM